MITYKDVAEKSMTSDKKASAQSDLFAFYVIRPISFFATIPFLYTSLTPNMISMISIIPVMIGFVISWFTYSKAGMLLSWLMFFIWDILDSVDGNVANGGAQYRSSGPRRTDHAGAARDLRRHHSCHEHVSPPCHA